MSLTTRRAVRHPRRHGMKLDHSERRMLERDGWRTTLEYREDLVRGRDGRLVQIIPTWVAEAERHLGQLQFASAVADTAEEAWARLRVVVEHHDTTMLHQPRHQPR